MRHVPCNPIPPTCQLPVSEKSAVTLHKSNTGKGKDPETQAKRFVPDGDYVRRWAPALSAPPIMALKESHQTALDAYTEIKD